MPRALFEKKGNAVYISHLDLMRVFQRSFKRAGLPLTHTQGFNPRPSVSIALPLSLGVESSCELLDFDLEDNSISCSEIMNRLNTCLIDGVRVLDVYQNCSKIKNLAFLDCHLVMEYDSPILDDAVEKIQTLFSQQKVIVEKKGKNGIVLQNIIPMIRNFCVKESESNTLSIDCRICCQNPTLNPILIPNAITKYLPELTPDFVRCSRVEIYDTNSNIFR